MFIITDTDIENAFRKTRWENDKCVVERIHSKIEKTGNATPDEYDCLDLFTRTFQLGRNLYMANRSAVDGYLLTREFLTDSKGNALSTEEVDYILKCADKPIGTSKSTVFADINFDSIATMGYMPCITKIVSNEPDTVVYFNDGSKIVVTCEKDDTFDAEKGIYIALLKKAMGSRNLRNLFSLMENKYANECETCR